MPKDDKTSLLGASVWGPYLDARAGRLSAKEDLHKKPGSIFTRNPMTTRLAGGVAGMIPGAMLGSAMAPESPTDDGEISQNLTGAYTLFGGSLGFIGGALLARLALAYKVKREEDEYYHKHFKPKTLKTLLHDEDVSDEAAVGGLLSPGYYAGYTGALRQAATHRPNHAVAVGSIASSFGVPGRIGGSAYGVNNLAKALHYLNKKES